MTYNHIEKRYLGWLYDLVCGPEVETEPSYRLLISELYNYTFEPIINEMDTPRLIDGDNLRYRFGDEQGYEKEVIEDCLFLYPCSVLELLVALASRFEDQIMDNTTFGDRTSLWFWIMITNLGLNEYTDERFDPDAVRRILYIFVNRQYNRDGSGGNIFVFKNRTQDIRKIDIWYQMCWFISDFVKDEECE